MDFTKNLSQRVNSRLNEETLVIRQTLASIQNKDIAAVQRAKVIASAYLYDRRYFDTAFESLAYKTRFNPTITRLVYQDLYQMEFDATEQMKNFEKPVLIIHGEDDIVNPDTAKYAHQVFPNSRLVMLTQCGHFGWLEKSKPYFEAILKFMDNLN